MKYWFYILGFTNVANIIGTQKISEKAAREYLEQVQTLLISVNEGILNEEQLDELRKSFGMPKRAKFDADYNPQWND